MEEPPMFEAMEAQPAEVKPRRPWIAAVLALLAPGMGQLYGGELGRAAALYLGYLILLLVLLWSGLPKTFVGLVVFVVVLLTFFLWTIWDAASRARGKQDYVLKPINRWYLYVAAIVAVSLV